MYTLLCLLAFVFVFECVCVCVGGGDCGFLSMTPSSDASSARSHTERQHALQKNNTGEYEVTTGAQLKTRRTHHFSLISNV